MKEKLDQALRRSSANIKAGSAPATDPTGLDKEDSAGWGPFGIEKEVGIDLKYILCKTLA